MIVSALLQSGKVKMCLISFKTITASLNAVSALKSAGIYSNAVSIDPNITKHGCSYGISLLCSDVDRAISLMTRKRVKYGDVIGR